MLQQTIRYCEKRSTGNFLQLLLIVFAFFPSQLFAQCDCLSGSTAQSLKNVDAIASDMCPIDEQSCCQRLLLKLSLAEHQVGHLSGSLTSLQQTLAHKSELIAEAMRQISWAGKLDTNISVFGLLKHISLNATEMARVQLAIASVRSELLMAKHKQATATIAASAFVRCLGG